ncbi:MAG: helix-turn-helix transcriptional regulator [Bacteroidaceae bacterium]|nr:helix-turn-helix transcriptional regulator [Bacteroidaceae bacterium]
MNNEKIRIRQLDATNDKNILGAETDVVQIARTACFICTRGGGKILLNGIEHTVEADSLTVYFPYSVLHIIEKTPDLGGIIVSCNLETIQPLLYKVSDFNGLFLIRQHPYTKLMPHQMKMLTTYTNLLSDIIKQLDVEEKNLQEMRSKTIREAIRQQIELLGNSFMLGIVSCYAHYALRSISRNRKDDVMQKFITQLYQSYKQEHDVSYYAEAQFLTCRYFSTIIKEKTGKTPSEWIVAALLGETKRLLTSSSKTIKEIAQELNFPNQSYFGKWFKNLVGCSPLEYKKGKKKTEPFVPEYSAFMGLNLFK